MEFPIKTLSQLSLFLRAFRKESGMTQARMASHLGVTQQTYAQLEANPESASIARLFKVLGVLNVELTLRQPNGVHIDEGRRSAPKMPSRRRLTAADAPKVPSKPDVKPESGVSGRAPDATAAVKRENW